MKSRKIGLVRIAPFLSKFFFWAMPRLLNFSNYPYTKGKVMRLERERELAIEKAINSTSIIQHHKEILTLLLPKNKNFADFARVGAKNDGAYVIPSRLSSDSTWVTIGLGFNCDFENYLAARRCAVSTFDHTIPWKPKTLDSRVSWWRKGWGESGERDLLNLEEILNLSKISGDDDWSLKFDIEGAEWDLLGQIVNLGNRFKMPSVVVCELHNLLWNGKNSSYIQKLSMLSSFYIPVYANGNNYSAVDFESDFFIYDAVEVSWVNKKRIDLLETTKPGAMFFEAINDPTSKNYPLRLGN
jgi:hypothetical protein